MPSLKKFVHPQNAYRLEYPAEWESLQEDEARQCGFGPKDRDDVGLWISIMPVSLDTDAMGDDLERMFEETIGKAEATNLRRDPTLRHRGLKADMTKEGEGGHYWLIAGGDLILFASSQVPVAERGHWNPLFDKLMSSLLITRERELLMRKAANIVMKVMSERHPEQEFEFDDKGIRGKGQAIHLDNMYRQVRQAPKHWEEIAKEFAENIAKSMETPMGTEEWQEIHNQVLPVLKPQEYIKEDTATRHLHTDEWLADVLICYVIKNNNRLRFITGWDLDRWNITAEALEKTARRNLALLPWPKRMEGSRQNTGGRLILIDTPDGLASSRILHPDLHKLFSSALGSPFWAGIPDRETLVVFSNRRALKKRIARKLKKDCKSSPHAITERPFLVTADGIALGGQ